MGVASIVVSQGRAYTTGNNGSDTDTIYCFDAATGAEIWKHSYPCDLDAHFYQGGTSATPTVDGDRVYSVSKKGDLFCLDAAKGTVIWSKSIIKDYGIEPNIWGFSSSPFIVGDVLYLNAANAGTAFDKKNGNIVWTSEKGPSGYSNLLPFKSGNDQCVAFMAFDSVEAVRLADGKSVWSYPWKTDNDITAGDVVLNEGKMFFGARGIPPNERGTPDLAHLCSPGPWTRRIDTRRGAVPAQNEGQSIVSPISTEGTTASVDNLPRPA